LFVVIKLAFQTLGAVLLKSFAISTVAKTSDMAECASLCLIPFIGANLSNLNTGLFLSLIGVLIQPG
jgi:hypothetical protein